MKKICIIANLLIPFLYIIKFFATKYALNSSFSGNLHILTWFAMPIVMFFINTFSEKQLKRLVPMYLISACIQIFGVFIEKALYCTFFEGNVTWTQSTPLIVSILNLILIPIGIAARCIAAKFKNNA